jgi:hypothetical protein
MGVLIKRNSSLIGSDIKVDCSWREIDIMSWFMGEKGSYPKSFLSTPRLARRIYIYIYSLPACLYSIFQIVFKFWNLKNWSSPHPSIEKHVWVKVSKNWFSKTNSWNQFGNRFHFKTYKNQFFVCSYKPLCDVSQQLKTSFCFCFCLFFQI